MRGQIRHKEFTEPVDVFHHGFAGTQGVDKVLPCGRVRAQGLKQVPVV